MGRAVVDVDRRARRGQIRERRRPGPTRPGRAGQGRAGQGRASEGLVDWREGDTGLWRDAEVDVNCLWSACLGLWGEALGHGTHVARADKATACADKATGCESK